MPLFQFMAITRKKKEKILEQLKNDFKRSQAVVFVNFHGLSVSSASELRKLLRSIDTKYSVAKKSLIQKALEEFKFSGEIPNLEGEIALAFSQNDPLSSIKELKNFAKKTGIKLLGGIFENSYISEKIVLELADISSKEILLARLVNIINSPIQGLVVTLNGITRNFLSVLSQIKK
ncbi:MAG: 50S ribosomal protein L10 [Patescibacteria group bacterium]